MSTKGCPRPNVPPYSEDERKAIFRNKWIFIWRAVNRRAIASCKWWCRWPGWGSRRRRAWTVSDAGLLDCQTQNGATSTNSIFICILTSGNTAHLGRLEAVHGEQEVVLPPHVGNFLPHYCSTFFLNETVAIPKVDLEVQHFMQAAYKFLIDLFTLHSFHKF